MPPPSGRATVPSEAAPVGLAPLATSSGFHTDRHETLPPGMVDPLVQMNLPPCSADRVYRVMPRALTSRSAPSDELCAVCSVVEAPPVPVPPVDEDDVEPQPAARATAAANPARMPIRYRIGFL